jgi:hypothetical protein
MNLFAEADSKMNRCRLADRSYAGRFFVMRYDGTEVEQVIDSQWEEEGPAWQPHRVGVGVKA